MNDTKSFSNNFCSKALYVSSTQLVCTVPSSSSTGSIQQQSSEETSRLPESNISTNFTPHVTATTAVACSDLHASIPATQVQNTPVQITSSQGPASSPLYSQPGPTPTISTDPVFPNYSIRQRSSNIRVENPDMDFLQTALTTCRSTISQQETEIKTLNESLSIRNKRIMQLEAQVGSAAESLASRDTPSDAPANLEEKVDLIISKFEKIGSASNTININQCNHRHNRLPINVAATQTDEMVTCNKCKDNHTSINEAEVHSQQKHGSTRLPGCHQYNSVLDQSQLQHQEDEYHCILCEETFQCKDNLRQHCESKHESETSYCALCGDIFENASILRTHIETQHASTDTHQTL